MADRLRLIGAVDTVQSVAVPIIEIERARAERIVRAACQATGSQRGLQMRPARHHFSGRRPVRPFGLAGDCRPARPAIGLGPGCHAIAHGTLARQDEVEKLHLRIDNNGPRLLAGRIVNLIAFVGEVHLLLRNAGDEIAVTVGQGRLGHALEIAACKSDRKKSHGGHAKGKGQWGSRHLGFSGLTVLSRTCADSGP